jgi:hypothetical protein
VDYANYVFSETELTEFPVYPFSTGRWDPYFVWSKMFCVDHVLTFLDLMPTSLGTHFGRIFFFKGKRNPGVLLSNLSHTLSLGLPYQNGLKTCFVEGIFLQLYVIRTAIQAVLFYFYVYRTHFPLVPLHGISYA